MNSDNKIVNTDPDLYTTEARVQAASINILEEVRTNAIHVYRTCGGHKLAARMEMVIKLIDHELANRTN